MNTPPEPTDRQATLLTYLGALPFALAALLAINRYVSFPDFLGGDIAYAAIKAKALAHSYAVVILSFVAGIQWGISLSERITRRLYLVSTILALISWLSMLFFPRSEGIAMVLVGFLVALWVDWKAHQREMIPEWFWRLRIRITTIVCLSLVIILAMTW